MSGERLKWDDPNANPLQDMLDAKAAMENAVVPLTLTPVHCPGCCPDCRP